MANLAKASFIAYKLNFLKEKKGHVMSSVEQYVDRIITAGNAWTESRHSKLEYTELNQMIDAAVEFLCEKCEELTGGSVGVAAHQLSQTSCEQPDLTSQSAASPSSTATTSSRQSAASPSSLGTTSSRQKAKPVQATDEISLKPVLARIAVMEEAMYSFRNNADKIAERQGDLDEQLVELLSKLSESDKKHSSRLKKAKEQISDVSDTQNAIEKEQKTSLQSLEEQLQKVSTTQDKLKVDMDSQAELVEKLVHSTKELESVKADIDGLNAKTDSSIDELNARIDNIIDDCTSNHENLETEAQDLADKVIVNTQTVKVISEGQDQNMTLLRELESRLQTMEADGGTNVKDVQKQAEKSETNLCEVVKDVSAILPRLQQLEIKTSAVRVGFSARTMAHQHSQVCITDYTDVFCNVGNYFNAASGIFTAPEEGLYMASISLWTLESNRGVAGIKYRRNGSRQCMDTPVSETIIGVTHTSACNVGVVNMKPGDVLFAYSTTEFKEMVTFACGKL